MFIHAELLICDKLVHS